ncbi:MAG: hypothetical protein EXR98_07475 [Gemmataceae bacterium]|nr:hypothetical protein [Gemmataceae bacterium]
MKHFTISWIALVILGWLAPVQAQESAADLVAKLGSRNYAERVQAARKLELLGKAALPALEKALAAADLETRRRSLQLMERIEDLTMLAALVTPTSVRLRIDDLPVSDAVREVEKQTGLNLGNTSRSERITLDTGVMPYWQAWGKFRVAAKLAESDYALPTAKVKPIGEEESQQLRGKLERAEITIPAVPWAPQLNFNATPSHDAYSVDDRNSIRVRVRWHSLDEFGDPSAPHGIFAVEVRAEPRLELAAIAKVEITKVVDDEGRERSVTSNRLYPTPGSVQVANLLAAYVGEIQYGGLVQLKAIAWQGPPCSLKEVHGRVRVDVTVRRRMLEMPQVLKAAGKQMRGHQGITVKVLEAEVADDGEVHLRLRLDHLESLTPQTLEEKIIRIRPGLTAVRGPMDVALERLELVGPAGQKAKLVQSRYEQIEAGKSYDAVLRFAIPGVNTNDLTLVMTKAARTVPLEIPFLVRDVRALEKK